MFVFLRKPFLYLRTMFPIFSGTQMQTFTVGHVKPANLVIDDLEDSVHGVSSKISSG